MSKKINVPTDLAISLLEKKINEGTGGGNKWVLVHGFPRTTRQVTEFEKKVSISRATKTYNYLRRFKGQTTYCFSIARRRKSSIVEASKKTTVGGISPSVSKTSRLREHGASHESS